LNLKHNWFNLRATDGLPVNLFPWLSAKDLASFARALNKPPLSSIIADCPPPLPRHNLAQVAGSFHQCIKTNTDNVVHAMESFEDGQEVLRCSYQPNVFPALTIVSLPILLSQLADYLYINREKPSTTYPQVFFLLDYDVASDNRFRVAHFPSQATKNGYWTIAIQDVKPFSNKTMFSVPPPSPQWLDDVFSQIHTHMLQEIAVTSNSLISRRKLEDNIDFCRELARLSLQHSKSFTEFNSFFISLLINRYWCLPTIFIPGHEVLKKCDDHFIFLWDSSADIYKAKIKAAELMDEYGFLVRGSLIGSQSQLNFWIICECGERLAVNSEDIKYKTITAQCLECGRTYQYKKNQQMVFRELVRDGRVMPRIVADNIFDTIAWGFSAGVSYVGAAEHYLFTAMVESQLGIKPLPEFLWRADLSRQEDDKSFILSKTSKLSQDKYGQSSNTIRDIQFGKASCLYYLTAEDPKEVKSLILKTLIK